MTHSLRKEAAADLCEAVQARLEEDFRDNDDSDSKSDGMHINAWTAVA
jgi:hypothetical protein